MRNTKNNEQTGYILVDVCIAAIMMAAVMALIGGYNVIARAQKNSEAELTAVFLAQEQIAHVVGKGNDYLKNHIEYSWQGENSTPLRKNGISFEIDTKITIPSEGDTMRNISVVVSWSEAGKTRERNYERLVYVGKTF